ncbi:MAG: TAT-variant-translocated molybdopterin oxidoreductase [Bacteroidales bacterium]|nr:TAT-variant-translocated molybdopterin oxidoreductase [Bacteroidales bacterium]MCF8405971.1 TAT-variant-translocated molybdopterin oxidoreductase [Bacteroidales bacterium]
MKNYWRSLDEYNNIPDNNRKEFETEHKNTVLGLFEDNVAGAKASRRDFLKLFGFSVTTAALTASCERPVHKAIPYVIQPEQIIPGMAKHYASSFFDGKDYCPVVVKTRDGRPIKIEGNKLSPLNAAGGTTARVQASVLSLYDDARYKSPLHSGDQISWEKLDSEIRMHLNKSIETEKKIVILSSTLISPSTIALIEEFKLKYSGVQWIQYDPISVSAIREAHKQAYSVGIIPFYRFDKAETIVSFGADFLGTWLSPGIFIQQYASARKLSSTKKNMVRHYQIESGLSLTGSNADHRIPVKPSQEKDILANLYLTLKGESNANGVLPNSLIDDLKKSGAKSLVVSGSNDPECQSWVIAINELLGSVGTTIHTNEGMNICGGSDAEMTDLISGMKNREISGLMFFNTNPLYDYPDQEGLREGMDQLDFSLSFSVARNETAQMTDYIVPLPHYLESWDDAELIPGHLSLTQACIQPLFNSRSFQDSLLVWMNNDINYQSYLKNFWEKNYFDGKGRFIDFWNNSLRDGVIQFENRNQGILKYAGMAIKKSGEMENKQGFELCLYESVQMGDGRHANNPWLQELPDPISKHCWENVLLISVSDAEDMQLKNGDVVAIGDSMEVPVLIQAGQAKSCVSLALGYGRTDGGKVANNLGVNGFSLIEINNGFRQNYITGVQIVPLGKNIELALTQTHNSMEGRPIVRESNLDEYLENAHAGNEMHEEVVAHSKSLYEDTEFDGFHWGLAVDLNACVGCNACVISCQAENNIPVVGKDEVRRRRIMHWIKIDRYYSEEPENPKVSYQPLMCQHCDNAPCENVCPVSATNHSSEGLNQMSYNRCIGTKYCINNCPYRTRRFNWYKYAGNDEFDYNINSDLGKMVLNPDVTVRSRGVVEKCSFCVQRIQEKKLEAKLENRPLRDGEIQPACVQSCPAGAMIFGNLKDKNSKISKMMADERNYHLLEELHTLPSVGYLTKVRNESKDNLS